MGAAHLIELVALHGALRDVADQVGRHGYIVLFALIAAESFGFPLPGEVSLLVGAYEAQRGVFVLGWVIVIGAVAAITGDNLAYLVGRTAGRPVVERLLRLVHVPPTYLERMDASYRRRVGRTVFVARQISPVRGLAAFSAGGSRVDWRRFFVFNAAACLVWATAVTLLASLFVRRLDELADDLGLAGLGALFVVLVVGAVILWRRVRRRIEHEGAASRSPEDASPNGGPPGNPAARGRADQGAPGPGEQRAAAHRDDRAAAPRDDERAAAQRDDERGAAHEDDDQARSG